MNYKKLMSNRCNKSYIFLGIVSIVLGLIFAFSNTNILSANAYIEPGSTIYELGDSSRCVGITAFPDIADPYGYKTIRTNEYTITDSGRMNQPYDEIRFNDIYGVYPDGGRRFDHITLRSVKGYKTIAVETMLDIKEVDDGYQYIYIYQHEYSHAPFIIGGQIEHGPGKKDTTYATYYFYFEINIYDIQTLPEFVIRYGADGAFSDTWKNKNLKIQVGASKDNKKATNIWRIIPSGSYATIVPLPYAS